MFLGIFGELKNFGNFLTAKKIRKAKPKPEQKANAELSTGVTSPSLPIWTAPLRSILPISFHQKKQVFKKTQRVIKDAKSASGTKNSCESCELEGF